MKNSCLTCFRYCVIFICMGLLPATVSRSQETPAGSPAVAQPAKQSAECASKDVKPCGRQALPPQTIEGPGGIFMTPVAYLVNPDNCEKTISAPAVAVSYVGLRDKNLLAATVSLNILNRAELSYGFNNLQLGDLRHDIKKQTGLDSKYNHTQLHNFNLRVNLLREGSLQQAWLPAVTAGAHFKYNENIDSIDHRLGGALTDIGMHDNKGFDFTLTASKTVSGLFGRPLILTAGVRYTEACHIGLLGFSNDYSLQPEGNFAQFLTDRLMVAGEYRAKPDKLRRIPRLVGREEDWWSLAFCYIINTRTTFSFGYLNPGTLLNEDVNNGWGTRLMFSF